MPKSLVTFVFGLLCLASSASLLGGCAREPELELLLAAKRPGAATAEEMEQVREIIARRIGESGASATVARRGPDRILVTLGDRADAERVKALIGRSGRLEFRLVDLNASPEQLDAGRAPLGSEILPVSGDRPGERMAVKRRAIVTGAMVADARQEFDANSNPSVAVAFDAIGTSRFARATRDNVGRPFAIVLDDEILSAPVINEPILGGRAQISGDFTVEEAERFAIALRSGPLPVDLVVVEERVLTQ